MKKVLMSLACLAIMAVAGDTKVVDNGNTKIFTIELQEDLHVEKNEDSLFSFIKNDDGCLYVFRATVIEDNRIELKDGNKQCGKDEVRVPTLKKVLVTGEDGMFGILGTKLEDKSVVVKKGRRFSVLDGLN